MNSRTSRPRSPISPTTTASQSASRASIESSTDLPTPEPAKTPRRWPRAAGGERVHRAHAEVQPIADPAAGVRRGRGRAQRVGGGALRQRSLAVDRLAKGVDHPAAPRHGRPHRRALRGDADLGAWRDPLDGAERHQAARGHRGSRPPRPAEAARPGARSPPARRSTVASNRRAPRSEARSRRPRGPRRSGDRYALRRPGDCANLDSPTETSPCATLPLRRLNCCELQERLRGFSTNPMRKIVNAPACDANPNHPRFVFEGFTINQV